MLIYNISREYDRIHSVELDGETGHYYPDRARMNPLEDSLGDVEIWVYNETNEEVDDYVVEPHFHVCKSWIEEKGKTFYEIDIEVKIKNIEQLNIWRSVTGNASWSGLRNCTMTLSCGSIKKHSMQTSRIKKQLGLNGIGTTCLIV